MAEVVLSLMAAGLGASILTSLLLQFLFAFTDELHPSGSLILFAQIVAATWTMVNYGASRRQEAGDDE